MRGASSRKRWWLASLCLLGVLVACGGDDGNGQDSTTGASSDALPTLTSDAIEEALTKAGLVSDCSEYGTDVAGDADEWGTLDGVRNCYRPDGGSVTWRAYEDSTSFTASWCAMRDQTSEAGISPAELGIVGLDGSNFRLDAVTGTPTTFENGLEGREPLAREAWEEIQSALGGGEFVQFDVLDC